MQPKRFRLGVDFHVWDGIFQGSRSHILGIYREAIELAPEIDFVFFLENVASLAQAHEEFRRPNVQLVSMSHAPALFRLSVQLPWLQWKHGIDLLHMQYRLPFVRLGACACTVHDILFETHPQYFSRKFVLQSKITYRHAVKRAAQLFTVSRFTQGEVARLYGVEPSRMAITYNAVDREHFHPGEAGLEHVRSLGLESDRYLLMVGRLEPRKNHLALIHAYARLGPSAPPLVIVGQPDFSYEAIFEAIRTHGLDQRVKLLSKVGDAILPALFRHCGVFVYPAFAEGFGMPVAEAMASGVPVITSDTTSMPEIGGDAALYVDPTSVDDIADKLKQLLSDDELRARMRERGLAQVDKFSWKQSAQVLIDKVRAFQKGL